VYKYVCIFIVRAIVQHMADCIFYDGVLNCWRMEESKGVREEDGSMLNKQKRRHGHTHMAYA